MSGSAPGGGSQSPRSSSAPAPTPASGLPHPRGSAYPCWQPREVEPSRSLRLEFESRPLQQSDLGLLIGALSLSFLVSNSTQLSQPDLKCCPEG